MKLTIIPVDGMVIRNGSGLGDLNLKACDIPADIKALQWDGVSGWNEFYSGAPNQPFTSLPAWANKCIAVLDEALKPPPPPTPEELIAQNKLTAEARLQSSDWVMLSDVQLANKTEWETYRAALRAIAKAPTVNPVWPTKPAAIWL
jgi:hypothetical protein